MGILNKIFGVKSQKDKIMDTIFDGIEEQKIPGRNLADHIVHNILAKGYQGSMKDIESEIRKRNEPKWFVIGVKERLLEYINNETIYSFPSDSDEFIFVHKNHLDKFLKGSK